MKRLMMAALLSSAALAHAQTTPAASATPASPAKKELVQKLLVLQQPGIEQVARGLVERPALQMMQEAGQVLQRQIAPDKREAIGKQVEADVKKYVEEATPLVRERAVKLAPATIGPILEEKFSEDELKQLIAWLESPTAKKYQSLAGELRNTFSQKLIAEMPPILDPKLMALDGRIRTILGVPPAGASAGPAAPARPASK